MSNSSGTNETPLLTDLIYTPTGNLKSWRWGNASLPAYQRTYDLDDRLTSYPVDLAGMMRTVTYNAAGSITGYSHSGGQNALRFDQIFIFDTADRLTNFTLGGSTTTYTYDANSNRIGQTGPNVTYTYDSSSNQLNSASFSVPRVYRYDAAGNRTTDGLKTYTYNDRGRLSQVQGDANVNMYYNAFGQRITKATLAGNTHYVYNENGQTIGEYRSRDGTFFETIYLGNIPISVLTQEGSFYVLSEQIGAPLVLAKADGSVVWDWRGHDPYGNNPPLTASASMDYSARFPGQISDVETGLFYNYFRDYDPQTGRYIESDPIGLAGGINTFSYVGANPIASADPTGLATSIRICLNGICPPGPAPGIIDPVTRQPWASVVDDGDGRSRESRSRNTPATVEDLCSKCKATATRASARAAAYAWAGVTATNGTPTQWSSFNPPGGNGFKKSSVWADFFRNNNAPNFGAYSDGGQVEEHPFGHPDIPGGQNHDCPHFVATNSKGITVEFPYRPGS